MKAVLFIVFGLVVTTQSSQVFPATRRSLISTQTSRLIKDDPNGQCPEKPSGTIHNFDNDNYEFAENEIIYKCNLENEYFQFPKRFTPVNCKLVLHGCSFEKIQGTGFGGAIYLRFTSNIEVDTINLNLIEKCKFDNCKGSNGGAIYFSSLLFCNELDLINDIFSNNQASYGGSLYLKGYTETIKDCQFINNHATTNSHDMHLDFSKASQILCNINVQNNKFEHTEENTKNSSLIYINCQKENGRFKFNSNTIKINPKISGTNIHMFLFDVSAKSEYANSYDYSNNCISPYEESLISNEADKLILQIDFEANFKTCTDTEPTTETTTTETQTKTDEIAPTKDVFTEEPEDKCPNQPTGDLYDFNSQETTLVSNKIVYACNYKVTKRIYTQNCVFLLHGCIFENLQGTAKNGIAICMSYPGPTEGDKKVNVIEKCQFKSCKGKDGGPLYISTKLQCYDMQISDCLFLNNEGTNNGGAIYFRADIGSIKNCQFINNKATVLAHDIYFEFGSDDLAKSCNIRVEGNKFEHTHENSKNSSIISLTCRHQGEKFYFNSNSIILNPTNTIENINIFLFNISGNSNFAYEWDYSNNCITPYDENLVTSEEDKNLIKIDFEKNFHKCDDSEESPTVELPPFVILDTNNCSSTHRCHAQNNENKKVFVQVLVTHFNDFVNESNGGAVYIVDCGFECSGTNFTNCVSNAGGGGGIYIKNTLDFENHIDLYNLYFTKCKAIYGSAICVSSKSELNPVTIESCTFHYNSLIESNNPNVPKDMIGGCAIFIAARKGTIFKCSYKGNTGNGGSVLVYNNFEKVSKLLHTSKSNLFLSINECSFEQEEEDVESSSAILYVGGKEGSQVKIENCDFKGKLKQGQHYIDGKLMAKNSPIFIIESCTFDDKINAVNNIVLMESIQKNDRNLFLSIPLLLMIIVGIAFIVFFLIKSDLHLSEVNSNEQNENKIDDSEVKL